MPIFFSNFWMFYLSVWPKIKSNILLVLCTCKDALHMLPVLPILSFVKRLMYSKIKTSWEEKLDWRLWDCYSTCMPFLRMMMKSLRRARVKLGWHFIGVHHMWTHRLEPGLTQAHSNYAALIQVGCAIRKCVVPNLIRHTHMKMFCVLWVLSGKGIVATAFSICIVLVLLQVINFNLSELRSRCNGF